MKMFGRMLVNVALVMGTIYFGKWLTNDNFQDMVIGLFAITLIEISALSDKVGDLEH